MTDIVQFIESLGELHDATVTEFLWLSLEQRLELGIEDLYWNFERFPEYPGAIPGRFIFSQVSKLYPSDVDLAEGGRLMIYDWLFQKAERSNYSCEILFSPGGRLRIECGQIECLQGAQLDADRYGQLKADHGEKS